MTPPSAPPRIIDLSAGDDAEDSPRHPVLTPTLWFAGWTAVVFAMASLVSAQKSIPLRYTLPSEAVNYYTLAAASLVVWAVSSALARRCWSGIAQTAAHLALAIVVVTLWQTTYALYLRSVIGARVWESLSRESGLFQLMNAAVFYGGVVGGTLAVQAARRARGHERRQHALALLARDAELRALTAQIEPHFLLNALTSVLALMEESPADARVMIERLAELLTSAFDSVREPEVTLGREMDLISAYLAIEQVRFGARLNVTVDVPEALRTIAVPPFVLQPLVENAVRYAVAPCTGPTTVAIRARRRNGAIRLEVADSGPGFVRDHLPPGSHGISLTEQRLQAFSPGATLLVEPQRSGGCTVAMQFAARAEPLDTA